MAQLQGAIAHTGRLGRQTTADARTAGTISRATEGQPSLSKTAITFGHRHEVLAAGRGNALSKRLDGLLGFPVAPPMAAGQWFPVDPAFASFPQDGRMTALPVVCLSKSV